MNDNGSGPRTRDFSKLYITVSNDGGMGNIEIRYVDAHVTFWPDGWVEVYGNILNSTGIKSGKTTDHYSKYKTVAMTGDEKHHD